MPQPNPIDPPSDFDFMIGDSQVQHRRLNSRMTGCTEWTEFAGLSSTRKILGGFGNVEDNLLCFPDGDVRAVAMRSFDANPGGNPKWEQSFSDDGGKTWETNWTMEFARSPRA